VGDADRIRVRLHDGREFEAKRVGSDPQSEVAVIRIEGDDFPALELGNSEALEIGEWVMAIGSPFGLRETVTVGVVSAKGRGNVQITDYEDFIQTDAAINPGNSGGPLLNMDGKVVGINTAIFSQSGGYMGIGFAIPSNLAQGIAEQIISNGKVSRSYIGVNIQDLSRELAESLGVQESRGILVSDVVRGSPAEKAGLRQADIIQKLDGKDVKSVTSFRAAISSSAPGTVVRLGILRDGKPQDVRLKTAQLPEDGFSAVDEGGDGDAEAADLPDLGLDVQDLTNDLAAQHGYRGRQGVLVSRVRDGSPAAEAGIETGHLITAVNRKPVSTVREFEAEKAGADAKAGILLQVRDTRGSRFVVLKAE
jgi:serine protease Do